MAYRKSIASSPERFNAALETVHTMLEAGHSDVDIADQLAGGYQEKEVLALAKSIQRAKEMKPLPGWRYLLIGCLWFLLAAKILVVADFILAPHVGIWVALFTLILGPALNIGALWMAYRESQHSYLIIGAILSLGLGEFLDTLFSAIEPGSTVADQLFIIAILATYATAAVATWKLYRGRPADALQVMQGLKGLETRKRVE